MKDNGGEKKGPKEGEEADMVLQARLRQAFTLLEKRYPRLGRHYECISNRVEDTRRMVVNTLAGEKIIPDKKITGPGAVRFTGVVLLWVVPVVTKVVEYIVSPERKEKKELAELKDTVKAMKGKIGVMEDEFAGLKKWKDEMEMEIEGMRKWKLEMKHWRSEIQSEFEGMKQWKDKMMMMKKASTPASSSLGGVPSLSMANQELQMMKNQFHHNKFMRGL